MEEIVRSISLVFIKYSSTAIRSKFAKLKEMMKVLTTEDISNTAYINSDTFTQLTALEVKAISKLRTDSK